MTNRTEYSREYSRKYREANPEKMAEYNRTQMERRRARRVVRQAVCAFCGKTFTVGQKHIKYCSRECMKREGIRRQTAKVSAMRAAKRAEKAAAKAAEVPVVKQGTCPVCGKTFTVSQKHLKYCSKECHDVALRRIRAAYKVRRMGLTAGRRQRPERDAFGLTAEQRNAVIRAQNGSRDDLWAASQTWTAKQHEFAKARFAEIHQLGHKSAWGIY